MITAGFFRLVQGLIFIAFIFHRAYYTKKYPPDEDTTLEEQQKGIPEKIANLLAIPALISTLLYLIYPEWMLWSSFGLPVWVRWLGILFTLTGFVLLEWSHRELGKNWSDQPRIMEAQQFVSTGPYQWIRHPIYTAFLLILGSTLLVTANWFIGGLWIILTAVDIKSRIRFEEEKMLAQFGEAYQRYLQSTGTLLPRFRK